MSLPSKSRFRFPADWESQEGVWFSWPVREDLWPGKRTAIRKQLAQLYQLVARYQPVYLLCPSAARAELLHYMKPCGLPANLLLFDFETDDVWCRDYGPLFVFDEAGASLSVTDWGFNAWGEKFPQYLRDAAYSCLYCPTNWVYLALIWALSWRVVRLIQTEPVLC